MMMCPVPSGHCIPYRENQIFRPKVNKRKYLISLTFYKAFYFNESQGTWICYEYFPEAMKCDVTNVQQKYFWWNQNIGSIFYHYSPYFTNLQNALSAHIQPPQLSRFVEMPCIVYSICIIIQYHSFASPKKKSIFLY